MAKDDVKFTFTQLKQFTKNLETTVLGTVQSDENIVVR